MAHSHEELLIKLCERLSHPMLRVFVHIDRKSQPLFEKLSGYPAIRLIQNRVDVRWAHISQVEATLSSYREIKSCGNDFSHFLVISGQDYPVQPVSGLLQFLSGHLDKSLLGFTPLSKSGWAVARKRYWYHYYVPAEKLRRGLMMLMGIRRKFPLGLKPFGGPQWINLAREHMDYILDFCDNNPSLLKFLQTARFPEEMIFQTLLLNSHFKNDCINNDLRFVKWLPAKSNPEILTAGDWDAIHQANDKFFARKFDLKQSAGLIERLDQMQK